MWSDDPIYDEWRYERREREEAARRPRCDNCGEPIWEEGAVVYNGRKYCEDCEKAAWTKIRLEFWEPVA